jgi:hypothetical protein
MSPCSVNLTCPMMLSDFTWTDSTPTNLTLDSSQFETSEPSSALRDEKEERAGELAARSPFVTHIPIVTK